MGLPTWIWRCYGHLIIAKSRRPLRVVSRFHPDDLFKLWSESQLRSGAKGPSFTCWLPSSTQLPAPASDWWHWWLATRVPRPQASGSTGRSLRDSFEAKHRSGPDVETGNAEGIGKADSIRCKNQFLKDNLTRSAKDALCHSGLIVLGLWANSAFMLCPRTYPQGNSGLLTVEYCGRQTWTPYKNDIHYILIYIYIYIILYIYTYICMCVCNK